ncbi:MAG: DNA repair protein RecN [Coriobacteriales bacterium]
MIDELRVHDIALIEDAGMELSAGLTVLTGETGAGKTALLSALKLLSGQRADSKAVRDGAQEARAEARFTVGGAEHVAIRRLSAQGRSRCSLDGEMATVGQLADALSSLSIHGQHEQVRLLQPAVQVELLDRFIDPSGAHLQPYRSALAAYRAASKRCRQLKEAASQSQQELEYQRFVEGQISAVDPRPGEYEQLEAELPRLQGAQQIAEAVQAALGALSAEGAVLDELAQAGAQLARRQGADPELDSLAERLDGLQGQLAELARDLRAYGDSLDCDPASLEQHLERLGALSGLMRRYGPGMEQVMQAWEHARQALRAAEGSPQELESAQRAKDEAAARLQAAGRELQATRDARAGELCRSLEASAAQLAMPQARFAFSFESLAGSRWGDAGPAAGELLYSPAPAAAPRPLRQIASGGELSRILLALECVMRQGAGSSEDTIVFDEVDAGLGGEAGEAVAQRLQELSRCAQVVVVTHLPQVAARADAHFVVSKQEREGALPSTTLRRVEGEERVAELARMLSGRADATALEHARSLLGKGEGR